MKRMNFTRVLMTSSILGSIAWLGACASGPTDSVNAAYAAATANPASRQAAQTTTEGKKPVWSVPSEQEVGAALEKKYLDVTKDFVKLKKNDDIMFCKRYREIGSSIARINCLTVAEVRTQVDNMDQYRQDMRNRSGKCTLG